MVTEGKTFAKARHWWSKVRPWWPKARLWWPKGRPWWTGWPKERREEVGRKVSTVSRGGPKIFSPKIFQKKIFLLKIFHFFPHKYFQKNTLAKYISEKKVEAKPPWCAQGLGWYRAQASCLRSRLGNPDVVCVCVSNVENSDEMTEWPNDQVT